MARRLVGDVGLGRVAKRVHPCVGGDVGGKSVGEVGIDKRDLRVDKRAYHSHLVGPVWEAPPRRCRLLPMPCPAVVGMEMVGRPALGIMSMPSICSVARPLVTAHAAICEVSIELPPPSPSTTSAPDLAMASAQASMLVVGGSGSICVYDSYSIPAPRKQAFGLAENARLFDTGIRRDKGLGPSQEFDLIGERLQRAGTEDHVRRSAKDRIADFLAHI